MLLFVVLAGAVNPVPAAVADDDDAAEFLR
jgi:hypothetical protein